MPGLEIAKLGFNIESCLLFIIQSDFIVKRKTTPVCSTLNNTSAYDHFRLMGDHQLIFGYRGSLCNDLVSAIIQLVDSKLKEQEAPFRQKKSVINILIEGLQNSLFHSVEAKNKKVNGQPCLFLLGKRQGTYFIRIGNYIERQAQEGLKNKIDKLNAMDADEIQQMYLDVLDHGTLSDKGGAGLGFLRIIRDSGNKIEYSFENSDDSTVFYSMEIVVSEQAGK
jgi:hypothetical protein